jgi:DnaJ-class molecular chaperone
MREINVAYAVLSNRRDRESYDSKLRVKVTGYSETKPEHCEKCGQLTLFWHTEKKCSVVRSLQEGSMVIN